MNAPKVAGICSIGMFISTLIGLGTLTACAQSQSDRLQAAVAADELAISRPVVVGRTPDGQVITRIKIMNVPDSTGSCCLGPHWVYSVGPVVSVNTSGKTQTMVMLNGRSVDLTEARIQIDAALAAQQKAELEAARGGLK